MNNLAEKRSALISLSHELGAEHRHLAILGEGNTSARINADTFVVKASGSSLGTLGELDVVECRFDRLLPLMDKPCATAEEIDQALFDCRCDARAKKPSIEALFHAWLLSLPEVNFVGHTHPITVNAILCSPMAAKFSDHRMCPDEIVCCGPRSVLAPYTDPGLNLAQVIRDRSSLYLAELGAAPRVILLQNHGIITLGASAEAVKAAMYMTVKAAAIFTGAASLGGPVFLTDEQVRSIDSRRDEHYRQRALKL